MPSSVHRLFKNSFEFLPISDTEKVPPRVRGIYVLFHSPEEGQLDVVYVGMARGENSGVRGRLNQHKKEKGDLWTHFSVFQVWDNIPPQEIEELEGLFRHIYRYDAQANNLNAQKQHKPLTLIRRKKPEEWV